MQYRSAHTIAIVTLGIACIFALSYALTGDSHATRTLSAAFSTSAMALTAKRAGGVAVITPTYERPTRFADLVHISSTLQVAASWGIDVYWVLVEDGEPEPSVRQLLEDSGLRYDYLAQEPAKRVHREVNQRNDALQQIRERGFTGAVYMSDDDNAFRPELLRELAQLPSKSFTIFAVGNIASTGIEGAIFDLVEPVTAGESVMARIAQWVCLFCWRRWNVDNAGYAFHSDLLHLPTNAPRFSEDTKVGFYETQFLQSIEAAGGEFVVFPSLVNQTMAWHDHSEKQRYQYQYEKTWTLDRLSENRLKPGETTARDCRANFGKRECMYKWPVKDLPLARLISQD